MEKYEHIIQMEKRLDKHTEILVKLKEILDEFVENQDEYNKLKEYYISEQYREDLDKSNNGKFPSDLKCGVLSEDAVFDMIGDNYQTAIYMLEIATKIFKEH
ncbi:MAG: DUF4298 domain-containing protein [Anaerococcus sp.]